MSKHTQINKKGRQIKKPDRYCTTESDDASISKGSNNINVSIADMQKTFDENGNNLLSSGDESSDEESQNVQNEVIENNCRNNNNRRSSFQGNISFY